MSQKPTPGLKAKVMSIWIPKGGVGKSSRTYELGRIMAEELELKVIMLDLDSQRDLTKRVFGNPRIRHMNQVTMVEPDQQDLEVAGANGAEPEAQDLGSFPDLAYPDMLGFYSRSTPQHPNNVYDYFKPIIKQQQTLVCPPNLVTVISSAGKGSLHLLPGHPEISRLNDMITVAATSSSFAQSTMSAFYNLCKTLDKKYSPDIIIVDLHPDSNVMNGNVIMSSDGLLMPCLLDGSSKEAIRDASRWLEEWRATYLRVRSTNDNQMYMRPPQVKLLGTLQSHFTKRTLKVRSSKATGKRCRALMESDGMSDGAEPAAASPPQVSVGVECITSAYLYWMRVIDRLVATEVVTRLRGNNMAFTDAEYEAAYVSAGAICVGRVPQYNMLAPLAQKVGKPVPYLSRHDLHAYPEKDMDRIMSYRACLTASAVRLIKLLGLQVKGNLFERVPPVEVTPIQ